MGNNNHLSRFLDVAQDLTGMLFKIPDSDAPQGEPPAM